MAGTAKVVFEYEAANDDELTLRVGDVITDLAKEDDGWMVGVLNGKRGLFPDNFVNIVTEPVVPAATNSVTKRRPGNKQRRYCKVTFSYVADADDELSLDIGEVIEIDRDDEEGWYSGIKVDGKKGVFPSNFAAEISADEVAALKGPPKPKMGPPVSAAMTPPTKKAAPPPPMPSSNDKSVKRAKVTFAYEAQADDELTLKEGDIVEVTSTDISPGWWEGKRNGKVGVFPDNFVALIEAPEVVPESKPAPLLPPAKPGPPGRPKPATKSERPPPPAAAKPPAKVAKKPRKDPNKSPEVTKAKKSPEEKKSIFPKRPTIGKPRSNTLEGKKSTPSDTTDFDGLTLEVASQPLTHITQNRAGRRPGQRMPSRFANRASMPPASTSAPSTEPSAKEARLDVGTTGQQNAHFRRTSPSKSNLAGPGAGSSKPVGGEKAGTVVLGVLHDLQAEVAQLQGKMADLERKWRSEMKRLTGELQEEKRKHQVLRAELEQAQRAQPKLRLA